jgi:hypothetical protein
MRRKLLCCLFILAPVLALHIAVESGLAAGEKFHTNKVKVDRAQPAGADRGLVSLRRKQAQGSQPELSQRPLAFLTTPLERLRPADALVGAPPPFRLSFDYQQDKAAQVKPAQDKPAWQTYKNVQLFTDLTPTELSGAMSFISASLGVDCNHCHVEGTNISNWAWEKDDKLTKRTARKMIQMVFDLNKGSFGGREVINCYTCHKGRTQPISNPVLVNATTPRPDGSKPSAKPEERLPTVDEVLDKYVAALGGREAIKKLTTRTMKLTRDTPNGPVTVEFFAKAPNKSLVVTSTTHDTSYNGYDGTKHWLGNTREGIEENDFQIEQVRRDSDFYKSIRLKELFANLVVRGTEKIGDREAYVIEATADDPNTEWLYFDKETGLLLRRYREFKTVLGTIPAQVDYEDYKDVDGVKVPFTVRSTSMEAVSTLKFTEVKHNVPLDDAKFKMVTYLPNVKLSN